MKTIRKSERIIWFLWLLLLQDGNANFICPEPGRYLDILSDCERFFFCYENSGELLYETFKCPEGRIYSVEEARCITASNLQCKELTGATSIPSEFEKIDPIGEFICRGEGKFVNEFGSDCNSFITCTRISGQSYSMNLYYCPWGEIFSHYTFECVSNDQFQCPTTEPTKNETSSRTEIPISNDNLADFSDTTNQKTSSEPLPSTTIEKTTVTSSHVSKNKQPEATSVSGSEIQMSTDILSSTLMPPAENDITSFECETTGRFPNYDEPGCTTYIICVMANGTFFPTIYNCGEPLLFDPVNGRCSLDYICPDNTTPLPETTTNIPIDFTCPRSGRYPNTAEPGCKNYIVCSGSGPFNIYIIWCNETDLYSPERGRCVPSSEYTCSDGFTTETSPPTGTEFPTPSVCTRIGRFPNYNEPGCDTYVLCAKDQNGMFISAIHYCDNSFFDPIAGRCSLDYVCTGNTTPMPETTTNIPIDFTCPKSGRYPNTLEPGCKNYIFCKGSGPYTISIISCNGTDLYSPERGRCVPSNEYTCPDAIQTTTDLTSSSVTDEETTSEALPTTTTDETTTEDTTIEDTTTEEITTEDTTTQDTTTQDTTTQDITTQDTTTQDITTEDTTTADTTTEVSATEDTTISESEQPETELSTDDPKIDLDEINGKTTIQPKPSITNTDDFAQENHLESETTQLTTVFSSTIPSSEPSQNPTTPSETEANESIMSTIDVSTYPPKCMDDPVIQFICPESGRYKDKDSNDCKTYILCLRTVSGELVYAKLACEEGTLYSDDAKACVSTAKYSCHI